MIKPLPDIFMSRLLMSVYARSLQGDPLHKKAAISEMGVQDVKTGRKYLKLARRLGLIDERKSPLDRRKELLYPTSRLERNAEEELRRFSDVVSGIFLTAVAQPSGTVPGKVKYPTSVSRTVRSAIANEWALARVANRSFPLEGDIVDEIAKKYRCDPAEVKLGLDELYEDLNRPPRN
jgi:hypothetical protein